MRNSLSGKMVIRRCSGPSDDYMNGASLGITLDRDNDSQAKAQDQNPTETKF